MAARRRGISAWLVTWEWTSDSASVVDRIAAVISGRKSTASVAEFVEWYYALTSFSAAELVAYARSPKSNPYRATTMEMINHVPHGERILCGAHPWLYGRKVKNLVVESQPDSGLETVSWMEPPIFRWRTDRSRIEEAQPPRPNSVARGVRGRLSTRRASIPH
jgi:hypothetical protein